MKYIKPKPTSCTIVERGGGFGIGMAVLAFIIASALLCSLILTACGAPPGSPMKEMGTPHPTDGSMDYIVFYIPHPRNKSVQMPCIWIEYRGGSSYEGYGWAGLSCDWSVVDFPCFEVSPEDH